MRHDQLPEPGVGPFVRRQALKVGTAVAGMAPIGIRWFGKVTGPNGRIKPDGSCPACEFSPTHAYLAGCWLEIKS